MSRLVASNHHVFVLAHALAVNGGSSSLRWRMCSGPVSTSTELGPMTGATGEHAGGRRRHVRRRREHRLDRLRVADHRSCSPLGQKVSVKASPSVRAQRSIIQVGASAHIKRLQRAARHARAAAAAARSGRCLLVERPARG